MTTPSGLPLKALQYWGTVRGAVAQRASTADVWGAIRDMAAASGLPNLGISLQDFNQLRSAAVGVRNAGETLAKAPAEWGLNSSMIGVTPYARSLADRANTPQWSVGMYHTTADLEGNESTDYRMVRFTGQLPATKADLELALEQDAEALADKYGRTHVGIESYELLAI